MTTVDTLAEKPHSLGCSYGWHARHEGGKLIGLVDAHRGGEKTIVSARRPREALQEAVRQAVSLKAEEEP